MALRLRDRRRDPLPRHARAARARSTWPPTATWCSSASATRALRDTNQRVAMDGFSKIPGFIVPTLRERLARGAVDRQHRDAAGAVPRLPAALAPRRAGLRLPGPGVWTRRRRMPSATRPTRWPRSARDPLLWGPLAGDEALVGGDPRGARDASTPSSTERRMAELQRLHGRHALLTGAGGGIGLAVTEAYLARGRALHARSTSPPHPAPGSPSCWRATPAGWPTCSADVTRVDALGALVDGAAQRFGTRRRAVQQRRGLRHGAAARVRRGACTSACSTSTSRACSS